MEGGEKVREDGRKRRNAEFQKYDFAERELKRRYNCALQLQQRSREKRALEHRELITSAMAIDRSPAPVPLPPYLRKYYASQFMTEEWLTHPQYIDSANWMVTPRPLGVRCLLVASMGVTIAINRSGELMHTFQSSVPNGSEATGTSANYTVLDSVFNEETNSYFILDTLTWNGVSFYDHSADFRLLLTRQHVKELESAPSDIPLNTTILYPCNPDSIRAVYETEYPFRKDGLLFYRDTGEYVLGVSPEFLIWKDEKTSPFPVDSGEKQRITLYLGPGGQLLTLDKVRLHSLSGEFMREKGLRKGVLVVLSIEGVDCSAADPAVVAPVYLKPASRHKAKADQWSRILYQSIARSGGISIEELMGASAAVESFNIDQKPPVTYSNFSRLGENRRI